MSYWNVADDYVVSEGNTSDLLAWSGVLRALWALFLVVSSPKRSPGDGVFTLTVSCIPFLLP